MGSAIRDRGHSRSDFDLLIVHRGKRPTLKAPVEVDIRYASVEKIGRLVAEGDEVVCWAMKFGLNLYDPIDCWEQARGQWTDKIPLPSQTEANRRAHQTLSRAKEMLDIGDESGASDLFLAALTQFARTVLIKNRIFPASRPELPAQLRELDCESPLAKLLEAAMFREWTLEDLKMAIDNFSCDFR
jgi:hypothetical protein